jgi:hypothetical protein
MVISDKEDRNFEIVSGNCKELFLKINQLVDKGFENIGMDW